MNTRRLFQSPWLIIFLCGGSICGAFGQDQLAGDDFFQEAAEWPDMEGITGDWAGVRTVWEDHGVVVFGGYTIDVFGNTTGGIRTGVNYAGLLDFGLELDLEKSLGWEGARLNTTWLWLSGRDASEDLAGNFLTISDVAGFNTLRLFELWFEQALFEERVSLRLGQLAADSEFIISDYGSLFINGTFGWPEFISGNIPAGGPGYPMGALGVRLALQPAEWFTLLSAAFQGNVFEQDVNRHGFRYRLNASNGYTFLSEAQLRWNHAEENPGLPGQLKTGAWFQSGRLADPLADTTSSGNVGFYGIIDQMIFRERSEIHSPSIFAKGAGQAKRGAETQSKSVQGLGFFGRIAVSPEDRNVVNFYFDTGLAYQGLLPGRDGDTAGIAFAYAQISNGERASLAAECSLPTGAEMLLEATYQAQLTSWLIIQPDVQLIINPNATRDTRNAFLIGGRLSVVF